MSNPWFKFYGSEYQSDPKILPLNSSERSCWVTLLCLASQTENGVIKFLSEEKLMAMAGIPINSEEWKGCIGVLNKFTDLEMVTVCNANVTVNNWQKRQVSESYERVKRYREKRDCNVTETTEREKEREKERGTPNPSRGVKNETRGTNGPETIKKIMKEKYGKTI